MPRHQLITVREYSHHPEAQKIHLDNLHVRGIVLVPLNDRPAFHRGTFNRYYRIKVSLADHHAPAVLREIARKVLHPLTNLQILLDARMLQIESSSREGVCKRIFGAAPLPRRFECRETSCFRSSEAKHFPRFARCGTMPVRGDVRHHRAPQLTVSLIDVLNGALAVGLAWQVEVNVRPLSTFERQEPLKEQIESNRIDDGDFECVADNAIGSGAAALNQDVVGLRKGHDVPHDQEVPGKSQLFDDTQLVVRLLLCLSEEGRIVLRQVAFPYAFHDSLPQERVHRLPIRYGIRRKLIAKARHLELQTRG